ncbi:hypothetical protein CFIICLFH_2368 [Methylobacterium goesingense]|uniref:Transposase n=1 Tax=Methylobacterium goesingense TaxID=243690 RepID=A0ABV2L9Q3_9HYPH|nr:hypothetical protein CFIICLFH_2368 [Methylobacterium goesingense]
MDWELIRPVLHIKVQLQNQFATISDRIMCKLLAGLV